MTEEHGTLEKKVILKQSTNHLTVLMFLRVQNQSAGFDFKAEPGLWISPNLAELSNGVHEGTNRYEVGNSDLKTEQNVQSDINLEYNNSHFEFFVNGFTIISITIFILRLQERY
jgi:iron complex outermembrane receptor protein